MIYLCINLYKSMAKVGIIFRFCKFFLVFFSKTLKILLVFGHFYRLRSIFLHFFNFLTVRLTGLEPARRETPDPKSDASTNSATGAFLMLFIKSGAKVQRIFHSAKSFRANSISVSRPLTKSSFFSPTK